MLTQDRLRQVLSYDPETGAFRWKERLAQRVQIGDVAGCSGQRGRIAIRIDGELYLASRLAWLYMTGQFPALLVDHKNLMPSDNRWDNLREANVSQNGLNTNKPSTNKSGYKGISWSDDRHKWVAMITVGGRRKSIGRFTRLDNAKLAHNLMAVMHHGEFVRL